MRSGDSRLPAVPARCFIGSVIGSHFKKNGCHVDPAVVLEPVDISHISLDDCRRTVQGTGFIGHPRNT
jgi:hypothetical protein